MDKRKFNGGNSTKSKGIDKRKNQYKEALGEACTYNDVVKVVKELKDQAVSGEMPAIKLFLEYYLGKPDENINNNISILEGFNISRLYDEDKEA